MRTLLLILIFFPFALKGQISEGGIPLSFQNEMNFHLSEQFMPTINLTQISLEDSLDRLRNLPMRFGKAHDVAINTNEFGHWETINGEYKIWRHSIICPEALSVNLLYKKFELPEKSRFFVYNDNRDYVLGGFTSESNKGEEDFATGLVPGEKIILEYNAPVNSPDPVIEIEKVVHGYKNFFEFGDSGPCNNNVNCPEGVPYSDQINSVAMIVLAGGTRWCSGAMINNTCEDGTPYFLTANHCLTGSGVSNWMFYFNYQSPSCSNIDGPTNLIVTGARLVSTSSQSDFALLELDSRPPVTYNAYYAGWSNLNSSIDTSIAIHHPSGDIKKISFSYQPTQSTDYLLSVVDSTLAHWRVVNWDDGTTEGGSSGSPLFNTDGQIVGQLRGGFASCTNNTSDWYGKFSYSWDQGSSKITRLNDWLNPSQSSTDTLSGSYFPSTPNIEAAISTISNPEPSSCSRIQLAETKVINRGIDTINSFGLAWEIPGTISMDTIYWNGILNPGASVKIILDTLVMNPGSYTLNNEIVLVNGQVDANTCNNFSSKDFEIIQGNQVTIRMRTDQWPEELRVDIDDTLGNRLFTLDGFQSNKLDSFFYCLTPGCYDITVRDSWGDGITAGGFYRIEYKDSLLFSGSGTFGNCTGSQMPNGCFATHRVCLDSSLFQQLPKARFSLSDTLFKPGDTLFLTDLSINLPTTRAWTISGDSANFSFTNSQPVVILNKEGDYDVKLKVSNIYGQDSLEILNAFRVERESSITNRLATNQFKIFPNPSTGNFTIEYFEESAEAHILSLNGIFSSKIQIVRGSNTIDLSSLSKGIYLLKVISKKGIGFEKIVIE